MILVFTEQTRNVISKELSNGGFKFVLYFKGVPKLTTQESWQILLPVFRFVHSHKIIIQIWK